jgi:hypothetical protein
MLVPILLQHFQQQLIFAEWNPGGRLGRYPDFDNLRLAWSQYPVDGIKN